MDEMDNKVVLTGEDGSEIEFEFLDLLEYGGEEYVVLLPTKEETEDADEVVILKVETTDDSDEESFIGIDDEETLETVFGLFKEKFKDEFNFVD